MFEGDGMPVVLCTSLSYSILFQPSMAAREHTIFSKRFWAFILSWPGTEATTICDLGFFWAFEVHSGLLRYKNLVMTM